MIKFDVLYEPELEFPQEFPIVVIIIVVAAAVAAALVIVGVYRKRKR